MPATQLEAEATTPAVLAEPASVPLPVLSAPSPSSELAPVAAPSLSSERAKEATAALLAVTEAAAARPRGDGASATPTRPRRRAGGEERVRPPSSRVGVASFHGSVAIDSAPAGARVFVNSQLAGITPLLLEDLVVGSRAIRVEADGHAPWSSVVRVVANQLTSVNPTLSPTP